MGHGVNQRRAQTNYSARANGENLSFHTAVLFLALTIREVAFPHSEFCLSSRIQLFEALLDRNLSD